MSFVTVARPYARAAFELALEQEALDNWEAAMSFLGALLQDSALRRCLQDPGLTAVDKSTLVLSIAEGRLNVPQMSLVKLLALNQRLLCLPELYELFRKLRTEHELSVDVTVSTTNEISETLQVNLERALARRLKRNVKLSCEIDERLLGGIKITAGDLVIDGSVRGSLDRLAETLM